MPPRSSSLFSGDHGRFVRVFFAGAVFIFAGDGVDARHAQRLGEPAAVGQKAFGLARHVALLQVADQLRFLVAAAFAHGFEDALRIAASVVFDDDAGAGAEVGFYLRVGPARIAGGDGNVRLV